MYLRSGLVAMESAMVASHDNNSSVFAPSSSSATSTCLKQGRFNHGLVEDNEWRCLKIPRTEPQMLLRTTSQPLFSDGGEQMLSFSSSTSNDSAVFSHYQPLKPPYPTVIAPYMRSAGLVCESSNMDMHGVLARVRGPFTPSQWTELENQALIYKYIDANHPIPPSLLIPLRRSLHAPGFSAFPNGSFRSNTLGWGSFHLGFSGSADPEPGRCRRTDGKKWRCSRDAVADGKYCERHMNRGRHRSRKHVEGLNGHVPKPMPTIPPSSSLTVSGSGGTTSNNNISNITSITQQQIDRSMTSKGNMSDYPPDSRSLCGLSNVGPNPPGLELIPSRNASPTELGFISSYDLSNQQTQSHPFRRFLDDWPKLDHRTQLSTSIPMTSSDFSSSNSSPNRKKLTLCPLKFSREFDPIQMSLGVGGVLNEGTQRQPSLNHVSWGSSMGGPLGEVLSNNKNYSASSLNLLTDGWDLSPRIGSSPTGVLQKTAFGSLSSSTGSSPRAEYP